MVDVGVLVEFSRERIGVGMRGAEEKGCGLWDLRMGFEGGV